MDSPVRRYLVVLAAFVAVMLGGVVQAGALPVPLSIAPGPPSPSGLSSMVTFDARGVPGAAANAGYYSRPVLVSNNTLAGLGKGLLRRAVPVAAMLAAIEGAGWAINELTGQVLSGPPVVASAPPGTGYWTMNGNYFPSAASAGQWYASHMAANGFGQYAPTYDGLAGCSAPQPSGAYNCSFNIRFNNGGVNTYQTSYVPNNNPGTDRPYSFVTQPAPVADSALGQLVANNPALAAAALRNPDGSVNRNPDVMAAAQALANELAATDPAEQPDPTAEWDSGQQGGDPQAATDLEFPEFCSWAAIVCEVADWVMGPSDPIEDTPLPIEEIPITQSTWVSGLGNGSCPAPRSIGLSVGSYEMSYAPACELAGFVRPLVIVSALLLGAYIVVGAGRQG